MPRKKKKKDAHFRAKTALNTTLQKLHKKRIAQIRARKKKTRNNTLKKKTMPRKKIAQF